MKRFLLLVFLLPMMVFGQTEKEQKQQIKNGGTTQSSPTRPQPQQSTQEINQKREIRSNSTRNPNFNTPPNYNFPPRWNSGFGPVWYSNRWNRWGAPLNYHHYNDFYYSDRWGYRTPARVYYYKNGGQDTIISKQNKVRLGLNLSSNKEIGGWFTVGRDIYFKTSFNRTVSEDKSTFYNHPGVNFYNSTVVFSDKRMEDITKGWSVYFGVGREFKNLGVNMSLGFGQDVENYQFFDEYYELSNNGRYSFRNFVDNYTTLSVGLTKDIKSLSLSTDYDPIRKQFYFGLGFNF